MYISFEGFIQRLYNNKKCVLKLHNESQETGSILCKTKLCQKYAITELKSSLLRCLKAFRFHPYRVSVFQNFIPADAVTHIISYHWMLQSFHDRIFPVLCSLQWFYECPGHPSLGCQKPPPVGSIEHL